MVPAHGGQDTWLPHPRDTVPDAHKIKEEAFVLLQFVEISVDTQPAPSQDGQQPEALRFRQASSR